MQNEKKLPTSPENKGTFKKWLPAIALALVIHALLLIVFFNSQKDAGIEESELNTQTTEAATASEDLAHEKEVLLTLIEERTLTKTEEESAEKSAEDPDAEESKKEESTNSESDTKTEQEKKENEKNDSESSKDKKESQKNVTQNEGQKQQNTSPPLDSSAYNPQPAINPNDAVLLPRDLPQAEHNPVVGNNNYANTAQQSQDLSDQLSSAVNEIKEQKLREIEAQQQASRAAYLKNQPTSAQPKNSEPAADSTD